VGKEKRPITNMAVNHAAMTRKMIASKDFDQRKRSVKLHSHEKRQVMKVVSKAELNSSFTASVDRNCLVGSDPNLLSDSKGDNGLRLNLVGVQGEN
jgi:hypothetical protein